MQAKILRAIASRRAFIVILTLFVLQAIYIALSSRFPMALDEYVHFGVTQLHTTSWSPFLHHVPASAAIYGPVEHDPSFLYHYLLSFPLRLIEVFTSSQAAQVIILRFINIGIAVLSLIVYARLFDRLGLSRLHRNIVMFFIVMIPVMTLMAGQVTYDNLFFLMVALVALLAVRLGQSLQKGITDISALHYLLMVGVFTCFVKYAFVPAMIAIAIFVGVTLVRRRNTFVQEYTDWWRQTSSVPKYLLVISVIVAGILFAGSYGVNLVKYHSPIPSCDAVLSEEACKNYGPWYRDYLAKQTHIGTSTTEKVLYVRQWFRQMMYETFFLVGSKYDDNGVVIYWMYPALPILLWTAWILFTGSVAVLLARIKLLWTRLDFRILTLMLALYGGALFGRNLQFYMQTGQPVAIHGRYILPFVIPMIGLVVIAGREVIGRRLPLWCKSAALGIAAVIFLQGGVVTFINGSADYWMWPQLQPAITVNHKLRDVIHPLLLQPKL